MVPFLLSGAVLGAFVAMVFAVTGPDSPASSPSQELVLLAMVGGLLGGLVGAIVFLVAEWTTLR